MVVNLDGSKPFRRAPDRSNAAQKPSVAKTIIDEGLTALLLR
jgi:hypothetical protein